MGKRSSAELSEAINSMFNWYRKATACYVFLRDVWDAANDTWDDLLNDDLMLVRQQWSTHPHRFHRSAFTGSEWFSRGWTLQELIAPHDVRFFNACFQYIGSKKDLHELVAIATGIDSELLLDPSDLPRLSIAERMRWASTRQTTREEDQAYCLLGIFNVNMPLLYGEGRKAFVRLQLEIISKTDDESIFAWRRHPRSLWEGLLAPSPAPFAAPHPHKPDVPVAHLSTIWPFPRSPYAVTQKGLEFTFDSSDAVITRLSSGTALFRGTRRILLPLNCVQWYANLDGSIRDHRIAIRFRTFEALPLYKEGKSHALDVECLILDGNTWVRYPDFDALPEPEHGCIPPARIDGTEEVETSKVYFRQSGYNVE